MDSEPDPDVRFVVEAIFDLAGRGEVLLQGLLEAGGISTGDELLDVASGKPVIVIGLEFACVSPPPPRCTLVIARESEAELRVGTVLVGLPTI